jgi:hypothetical protein
MTPDKKVCLGNQARSQKMENCIIRELARRLTAALIFSALVVPAVSSSADFDCSLIYDEYDSLMGGGYLAAPENYVSGYDSWFSQTAFDTLQRGVFKLHPERAEAGVLVFRTNQNRHGKLLYYWTDPLVDGRRYLVISEVAWYARVADGAGLELFGRLRASSGLGVDLDTMALLRLDGEAAFDLNGAVAGTPTANELPGIKENVGVGASIVEGEPSGKPEGLEVEAEILLSEDASGDGASPEPEKEIILDISLTGDAADLAVMLDGDTGIYYLSALNGAVLYFPIQTLCRGANQS